jgi:hypothetical protein
VRTSKQNGNCNAKADRVPFLNQLASRRKVKALKIAQGVVLNGGTCDGGNSSSPWVVRRLLKITVIQM